MAGENLNNPTKTRAKGPTGRKLPSRKTKTEEEETGLVITKHVVTPDKIIDLDSMGKMNTEEFDRVWFIKVPSLSSLLSSESSKESIKASEDEVPDNNNVVNNNCTFETEKCEKHPEEVEERESESDSSDESDTVQIKSKKRWKNCLIL